jgi:hypothetical protein
MRLGGTTIRSGSLATANWQSYPIQLLGFYVRRLQYKLLYEF